MANPDAVENRLRIVEALARSASAQAMADTKLFLQRVAEIETFVLGSQQQSTETPPKEVKAPTKRNKLDPDFMD